MELITLLFCKIFIIIVIIIIIIIIVIIGEFWTLTIHDTLIWSNSKQLLKITPNYYLIQ